MGRGFFLQDYPSNPTSPCLYIDLYSIFCKTYLFVDTRPDHSAIPVVSVKCSCAQMELLLNLFWLTLAVPAVWIWRHESACAEDRRRFGRLRPFLLLGCILMLLFPVISATDDLQAMHQAMEEAPSERMVKPAEGHKSIAALGHSGVLPALVLPLVSCRPCHEACGLVSVSSVVLPELPHFSETASRAPPFSSPGEGVVFAA
jgi:hypothetical protein